MQHFGSDDETDEEENYSRPRSPLSPRFRNNTVSAQNKTPFAYNYSRPRSPLSPRLGYNTVSSQNKAPFAYNYDYNYLGKTSEHIRRSVNDRLIKFLNEHKTESVSRPEIGSSSRVDKGREEEKSILLPKRLVGEHDVSYLTRCLVASVDRASEMLSSAETVHRPEMIKSPRWIKHYSSSHRILIVGDGDFSFSTCLAKAFGCASNMTATSLDHLRFLLWNYASALPNLMELKARNCMVMHKIDATEMANHSVLGTMKFDRIIFNFPFAAIYEDLPQISERQRHKELVSLFMENARKMISENGEIHISHKTSPFFKDWNLQAFGCLHRLRLIEAVDFNQLDYPGYNTKYGFGGDDNFKCFPSKTYKFTFY